MKKNRQEKILELISRYEIDTQDELIECLGREGFEVTQATVSRDIRELGIIKMSTERGTYKYAVSGAPHSGQRVQRALVSGLVDAVLSVSCAQNIIVVKTSPGMSSPVAVAIDAIDDARILGCVSGDDTIIIVATDSECARELGGKMKAMLSEV